MSLCDTLLEKEIHIGTYIMRYGESVRTIESLLESKNLKILSSITSSVMSKVVCITSRNLKRSIFP
jgi:hypothetical protein